VYRRNVFPEDGYADLHHLESQAVWCHHISLLRALFSKSGPSAKLFEEPGTRDAEGHKVLSFCRCILLLEKRFVHELLALLEPGVSEFFRKFTTGIETHHDQP